MNFLWKVKCLQFYIQIFEVHLFIEVYICGSLVSMPRLVAGGMFVLWCWDVASMSGITSDHRGVHSSYLPRLLLILSSHSTTRSPITNTDRNSEGETERTWLQLLFRRVEEGTSKRWSKLNSKRTRYLGKLSQHRTQNNNLTTNTICLKLPQHFLCVFLTRDSEGRMKLRCLRYTC